MNAKEQIRLLAEKIINDLDIQDTKENQSRWLESLLSAALHEASSYQRMLVDWDAAIAQAKAAAYQDGLMADKTVREAFQASICYDEGRQEAYEDCAKIRLGQIKETPWPEVPKK